MEPRDPFASAFNVKKVSKIIESKETDELVECLKKLEVHTVSIGEGDSSEVFVAEGTPFEKVCMKRIKAKPKMLCNDIDTEHQYQIDARKAGVRTPLPLISMETEAGEKYLLMERIYGHSIGEIIAEPTLLPDSFDYTTFMTALRENVQKLHKADIHHRSLHMQNVMIEDATGLPVILDFGTATPGSGSDFTYEESVLVLNPSTGNYEQRSGQFEDDIKMVDNLGRSLRPLAYKQAAA